MATLICAISVIVTRYSKYKLRDLNADLQNGTKSNENMSIENSFMTFCMIAIIVDDLSVAIYEI